MPLGLGWESVVMLGQESTWGTPVSPTDAIEIAGVRGGIVYPQLQEDTFRGRSIVEYFRGAQLVELEFETELRYEGYELLWRYLFDKDTITTVNLIKQHVFEFDDTSVVNIGLTVDVKYGTASTIRYEGMLVDEAEIIFEIDKIAKVRWRLIGQTGVGATLGSPVFPTAPRIRWDHVTCEKADVLFPLVGATVRISNNLIRDRRELGSVSIAQPIGQERTVEATLRAYLLGTASANWFNQFLSDNEFKLELNALSGIVIPGSSPSDNYDFLLEMPVASIDTHEMPIPDRSPIIQELTIKARKDTAEVAKLTITNARATVP